MTAYLKIIWRNIVTNIKILAKISFLLFIIFAAYIGNTVFFPQKIPPQYQITVNKGQNLSNLAVVLKEDKIIKNKKIFLFILRFLNKDKKVTAGRYFIKNSISMWSLISRLTSGKPDQISIMILDGQTVDQVRAYIEKIPEINHITTKMTDQDLVAALKLDATSMEGFLYPSTYYIAPGQTDLELYQHSVSLMKARLLDIYNTKNQYTTYKNPYQMLIMASLIHKETANLNDLYLVSTVFNNRIRDKFKLQDDPSVFYGLRKYGKPVLQKRFQFDTPYNTYLHTGLPPTPICIPSINALKAAANPYNNPRLYYFVAIGSGKTKFSTSYNEHLNSVYKYLKNTKNNTTTNANNNVNRNVKKTTKNNYNSDKKKQKNNNHTINSKNNDIQF